MRNVPLLPEEELLLASAELPELSAGFRTRTLNAAIEANARLAYGRRAIWAAGLLFAVLGWLAWQGPLSTVRDEVADTGAAAKHVIRVLEDPRERCSHVSTRYGSGEQFLSAAGDDWRWVEAEEQSRREGARRLRMN